ncbi:anthrax toxin lethal factor-related metalloendopeptidase [Peribacillus deserti]|uniref:Toxin n=1 Tax=Peribacillus deserti TaxID=673318 RepID=A0A2N5M221_9BACI|nr:toxin [Peribacillus deserti]PLT28416.1 toxin [Peribacillus deserti]
MRKFHTAAAVFIIFFVVISTALYVRAAGTESGRTWLELADHIEMKFSEPLNSAASLKEIFLFPEGKFNSKEAASIIERVDHLPKGLLEKIAQHQIKIKLFTGKLTDNRTAADLKGKSPRGYEHKVTWDDIPGVGGSRNVLIKIGSSEPGNNHGSVNLELHELAHSVDAIVYGKISEDDEFRRIWKKERSMLFPVSRYLNTYAEEYFAEAFAMFYTSKDTNTILKRDAPLTYAYIKRLT